MQQIYSVERFKKVTFLSLCVYFLFLLVCFLLTSDKLHTYVNVSRESDECNDYDNIVCMERFMLNATHKLLTKGAKSIFAVSRAQTLLRRQIEIK